MRSVIHPGTRAGTPSVDIIMRPLFADAILARSSFTPTTGPDLDTLNRRPACNFASHGQRHDDAMERLVAHAMERLAIFTAQTLNSAARTLERLIEFTANRRLAACDGVVLADFFAAQPPSAHASKPSIAFLHRHANLQSRRSPKFRAQAAGCLKGKKCKKPHKQQRHGERAELEVRTWRTHPY
ncbi:hypothetical protein PPROV_000934600 [Pycnococcus provasolii]|uniref:Uncharacterized protein n=1 Tax=Pycnococcus provasolii TaxID=41880 RepID=A0A830HV66_9CHLO|nr:hypothetical protein PPROV_000934600 [Pycnococcus provasolii]